MTGSNTYGYMLVLASIVILIVAGTVTTLLTTTNATCAQERTFLEKLRSRQIADTALSLSFVQLRQATDGLDNNGNGLVDEGFDWHAGWFDPALSSAIEGRLGRIGTDGWTLLCDTNNNGRPDFGEPGVSPISFGGGIYFAYTVFSQNDHLDNDMDGITDERDEAGYVRIIAVGKYNSQTTRYICTGRFRDPFFPANTPNWVPDAAMLTAGDLTVTGNAEFGGLEGNVHANAFLSLQGSCVISGDATASGGLFHSGASTVQGFVNGYVPAVPVPHIDPQTLRPQADFVLSCSGSVFDADGVFLHDVSSSGSFHGWSLTTDGWQFSGTGEDPTSCQGTYFVEGSVHIAGTGQAGVVGKQPGGTTQQFSMSVIATGDIQMAGNTHLSHHHPDGLLFVAGGDVRLTGTPALDQLCQGLILAREQVFISGTPDIQGAIVSENFQALSDLVGKNEVPGTPRIQYDGGLSTQLPVVDPANPWFKLDPEPLGYEER